VARRTVGRAGGGVAPAGDGREPDPLLTPIPTP